MRGLLSSKALSNHVIASCISGFPRDYGGSITRVHTSSKLVTTDGLLLDSVKLDTGVFSASVLAALEAAQAADVGVDDTEVTVADNVTVLAVDVAAVAVLLVGNFFRMSSFAFHPSCKTGIFLSLLEVNFNSVLTILSSAFVNRIQVLPFK